MMGRVLSASPLGVEALPVSVEVDVRGARLRVSIVGLPDAATRESKDRLVPAITNSGYELDTDEITINLSPAGLRKEGTGYDLPMALGILIAKGLIPQAALEDVLVVGELALDGGLRPVAAILATAECAKQLGIRRLIVPRGNGPEAALIADLLVYEADSLSVVAAFLRGREPLPECRETLVLAASEARPDELDFREVKGQAGVKRVLEIAAAGGHNLLMFGPPGSGKSMLAKRLPGIMPPMEAAEIIAVTRIYSCAGLLGENRAAVLRRPFRAPHHTASPVALIGGGASPRPGEVTLAHHGVLFLDEFPEFARAVLEVLRQPLEDLAVTICRAMQRVRFPADFMLVAAMNPCPCGWRGDHRKRCQCSPRQIHAYRARISGPLLDRIDLHVEVPAVSLASLRKLPISEPSAVIARRVKAARAVQTRRLGSATKTNGSMNDKELNRHCKLAEAQMRLLESHAERLGYSGRVHTKILKIARTIADLDGVPAIETNHLLEALSYRQLDRQPIFHHQQEPKEVCP